jgi:hypothetical protein
MPHEGGASSTPRLLGSIIDVSGVLGHPPSRVTTTECAATISRRVASELCWIPSRPLEQRAQGRPGARCTRGLVCHLRTKSRTRAYRSSGGIRPSLRNGFTAYFVLFPVNGSFATVAAQDSPTQLNASTAASEPHDFAVRVMPASSVMASASTASHRAFRDDREPPLLPGRTGAWMN